RPPTSPTPTSPWHSGSAGSSAWPARRQRRAAGPAGARRGGGPTGQRASFPTPLSEVAMRAILRLMADNLERWRDEFPILSRTVYMISNSLGAMPRQTARLLAEYAETWATRGVRAWEERWWEMPSEIGNRIGRIIGAPDGSVSMHENV